MTDFLELSKSFHKTADLLEKLNDRNILKADVSSPSRFHFVDTVGVEQRNETLLKKLSVMEHQTNIISARFDELKKQFAKHVYFQKLRKHKHFRILSEEQRKIQLDDIIQEQRRRKLQLSVQNPVLYMNHVDHSSNADYLNSQLKNQSKIASACPSKCSATLGVETLLTSSNIPEIKSKESLRSVQTQTSSVILCDNCQIPSPQIRLHYDGEGIPPNVNFSMEREKTNNGASKLLSINKSSNMYKQVHSNVAQVENVSQQGDYMCKTKHVHELEENKIYYDEPAKYDLGFTEVATQNNVGINTLTNENLPEVCKLTQSEKKLSAVNENYEELVIQAAHGTETGISEKLFDDNDTLPSTEIVAYIEENKVEYVNEVPVANRESNCNSSVGNMNPAKLVEKNIDFNDLKNLDNVSKSNDKEDNKNIQGNNTLSDTMLSSSLIVLENREEKDLYACVQNVNNFYTKITDSILSSSNSNNVVSEEIGSIIEKPLESDLKLVMPQSVKYLSNSTKQSDTQESDMLPDLNSDVFDKDPILKEYEVSCKETKVGNEKLNKNHSDNEGDVKSVKTTRMLSKSDNIVRGHKPSSDLSISLSETDEEHNSGSNVPFAASASFQRLVGNISVAHEVQRKNITDSESESEDEIEKALATTLNSSISRVSINNNVARQKPFEDKLPVSTPDEKSDHTFASPRRKRSMKPTKKIKGKLSKAAISALGLSSNSETEPESTSKIKADDDDSDEFDFYD